MRIRWLIWLGLAGVIALHLFGEEVPVSSDVVPAAVKVPASAIVLAGDKPPTDPSVGTSATPVPALVDRHILYPVRPEAGRDLLAGAAPQARPVSAARSAATPASSAPVAPPVPYAFAGRQIEGSSVRVFLTRADKSFVAQVGDVLDGEYRVDAIDTRQVSLTHLASGTSQAVRVSESQ